jgi:hypothetical protein
MDARCERIHPRFAVFPQVNMIAAAEKIRLTVIQVS